MNPSLSKYKFEGYIKRDLCPFKILTSVNVLIYDVIFNKVVISFKLKLLEQKL